MPIKRRVFVSLPSDEWLPPNLNALKWGIVDEIAKLGYLPEIFTNPKGMPGFAAPKAWSKLPADLGGDIYASLADRTNTDPIRPMLDAFVESF